MTTPHPHAEFLHALADGLGDEFECNYVDWGADLWRRSPDYTWCICNRPDDWTFRRKPRTIRIGDMDVPEPMRVAPAVGAHYWIVSVSEETPYSSTWAGDKSDFYCLGWGLCQSTKEAAETHRKALILVSGGTP